VDQACPSGYVLLPVISSVKAAAELGLHGRDRDEGQRFGVIKAVESFDVKGELLLRVTDHGLR